jgi:hypothetical protein
MPKFISILGIFNFSYDEKWKYFKYLGIPIIIRTLPSTHWQPILEKIKSKFSQWGAHWLNPDGRTMLINYVLSAFPIYQFSMLLVPTSFFHAFVWELHRFLLKGRKSNSKHFHLVNWNTIIAPKTHGGLGIRDPLVMNKALREKFIWRLISRKKELCKSILSQKYFPSPYMRCLDNITHFMAFSQIWRLIKASPLPI